MKVNKKTRKNRLGSRTAKGALSFSKYFKYTDGTSVKIKFNRSGAVRIKVLDKVSIIKMVQLLAHFKRVFKKTELTFVK